MAKHDRLINEQEHHKRAFTTYYELGEKRSYQRLAQQLGVAVSTVKLWGKSFGWQQQIRERDAEVARQVADRTLRSDVNEQNRNKKIVHMSLVKLAKAIADGNVRFQLGDLERLIRLQTLLEDVPETPGVPQTADELIDLFFATKKEVVLEARQMVERWGYGQKGQPAGEDEQKIENR